MMAIQYSDIHAMYPLQKNDARANAHGHHGVKSDGEITEGEKAPLRASGRVILLAAAAAAATAAAVRPRGAGGRGDDGIDRARAGDGTLAVVWHRGVLGQHRRALEIARVLGL